MRQPPHRRLTAAHTLVLVTGVPGAGKTTLGRALAARLGATFLSLDEVKEALWAAMPSVQRWALRAQAEEVVFSDAASAPGLVVLDAWVAPHRDDARIADRLRAWNAGPVVQIACVVAADVALRRYSDRPRSGPHEPPDAPTLQRIRDAVPAMSPLGVGSYVEVDTTHPVDVDAVIARLTAIGG